MSVIDAYTGRLPGRFICEGFVAASPEAVLAEAAPRLEGDVVTVTAAALNGMVPAVRQALRDRASSLGLRLREDAR